MTLRKVFDYDDGRGAVDFVSRLAGPTNHPKGENPLPIRDSDCVALICESGKNASVRIWLRAIRVPKASRPRWMIDA